MSSLFHIFVWLAWRNIRIFHKMSVAISVYHVYICWSKKWQLFLKSYFISGSGGHIGLDTTQFQHVFNKYTNSQLSQTKIMEMLDVFKKTCQKIQYREVIDADNNYSNIQFAQNARRRTQKKTFSMRKCRNHPSNSVSFLASIAWALRAAIGNTIVFDKTDFMACSIKTAKCHSFSQPCLLRIKSL